MFETIKNYLRYTSLPIILVMIALMAFGVAAISVSEQADSSMTGFAAKQWKFALLGLAAFFLMTLLPYQRLGQISYLLFGLTIVMLVGIFALPAVRGSHRWVDLGPVNFQPSEIAKFSLIIMLAWYLRYGDNYRRFWGLAVPVGLTLLPMGLVLLEPDLGTSMLFLPTMFFMLFVAGARLKHLVIILAAGFLLVFMPLPMQVDKQILSEQVDAKTIIKKSVGPLNFYSVNKQIGWNKRPEIPLAYCRIQWKDGDVFDVQPLSLRIMMGSDQTVERAQRISAWLQPDDPRYARGKGYQPRQARLILGSGGWDGRSDWNDTENFFRILPDDHTDFIFCVIGGQWGYLGCLTVFFLYSIIFVLGAEIAVATYDPFGRLLVVGVLALLFSQIIINIGMTLGLTPVTGMTLPWISYGGSSLVVNCAALGLLVNVGQHRPILLGKRPFEHGQRKEKSQNCRFTIDVCRF